MDMLPKSALRTVISLFLVLFCYVTVAQENDDQYLLSSKSYDVLTEARELMDSKEYSAAESKLNNLLNSGIGDYEKAVTYQTLGYVYLSMNSNDKATTAFMRSVDDNALPPDVTHEINYIVAQLLAQAGRYQECLEYLLRWFEREKQPPADAHIFLASIYYQLEDYRKMIPQVQSAIDKSTTPQRTWYEMLLSAHYQIDDLKSAAALLEKMVVLYPETDNYWLQLAATYHQNKNYKKSLAMYKLALSKDILDEEGIIRLARLYLNEHLPYQAATLLDEKLREGTVGRTRDNLQLQANSWLLAREYDHAVTALTALAETNDDPDTWYRIGRLYFEQEKWKDAITALERAVTNQHLENPAEAWLLLGIAAYHADENVRSTEALKKAITYRSTKQQAEWWLNKAQSLSVN